MQSVQSHLKLLCSQVEISNQQQPFEIGKFTFKPGFTRLNLLEIFKKQEQLEVLNKKSLWVNQNQNPQIIDCLKYIDKCTLVNFMILGCHSFTQISYLTLIPIKFKQLKMLMLFDGKIQNIESLFFINAPLLEMIKTRKNQITHVSNSINKGTFSPSLKIYIDQPHIRSFNGSRCPNLIMVGQYDSENKETKFPQEDISYLAKIETQLNKYFIYYPLNLKSKENGELIPQKKALKAFYARHLVQKG